MTVAEVQRAHTLEVATSVTPLRRGGRRLLLLGAGALLFGSAAVGTFASFTGSTTNAGNTFATGTLVLSDKVGAGTACLSSDGIGGVDTNANTECTALFGLNVRKPGDSGTVDLDIRNDGSITASALQAFAGATACASDQAPTAGYHGTGDLCTQLEITIQEFADTAARTSGSPTGGWCWYGGSEGADSTCTFSPSRQIADFDTDHADFNAPLGMGPISNGVTRYFRMGLRLPSGAGDPFQGRRATFGLTWRVTQ
jgi:hypothetical protein